MRRSRRALCGILAPIAVSVASVPFTPPAAAGYLRPSCHGFDREGETYSCRAAPREWARRMRPDTRLTLCAQAACAVLYNLGARPYDLDNLLPGLD